MSEAEIKLKLEQTGVDLTEKQADVDKLKREIEHTEAVLQDIISLFQTAFVEGLHAKLVLPSSVALPSITPALAAAISEAPLEHQSVSAELDKLDDEARKMRAELQRAHKMGEQSPADQAQLKRARAVTEQLAVDLCKGTIDEEMKALLAQLEQVEHTLQNTIKQRGHKDKNQEKGKERDKEREKQPQPQHAGIFKQERNDRGLVQRDVQKASTGVQPGQHLPSTDQDKDQPDIAVQPARSTRSHTHERFHPRGLQSSWPAFSTSASRGYSSAQRQPSESLDFTPPTLQSAPIDRSPQFPAAPASPSQPTEGKHSQSPKSAISRLREGLREQLHTVSSPRKLLTSLWPSKRREMEERRANEEQQKPQQRESEGEQEKEAEAQGEDQPQQPHAVQPGTETSTATDTDTVDAEHEADKGGKSETQSELPLKDEQGLPAVTTQALRHTHRYTESGADKDTLHSEESDAKADKKQQKQGEGQQQGHQPQPVAGQSKPGKGEGPIPHHQFLPNTQDELAKDDERRLQGKLREITKRREGKGSDQPCSPSPAPPPFATSSCPTGEFSRRSGDAVFRSDEQQAASEQTGKLPGKGEGSVPQATAAADANDDERRVDQTIASLKERSREKQQSRKAHPDQGGST